MTTFIDTDRFVGTCDRCFTTATTVNVVRVSPTCELVLCDSCLMIVDEEAATDAE